jgi:hypothetical protein
MSCGAVAEAPGLAKLEAPALAAARKIMGERRPGAG